MKSSLEMAIEEFIDVALNGFISVNDVQMVENIMTPIHLKTPTIFQVSAKTAQ